MIGSYVSPFVGKNPMADFGLQLAEAIRQQQLQAQQKAQILQALGFAPNMAAMGAIPYNSGIIPLDGKAYVRPGGIPPEVQQMLEGLLGLRNRNVAQFQGYTDAQAKTMHPEQFQSAEALRTGDIQQQASDAKAASQLNDYSLLDRLLRLYPELLPSPPQIENSGTFFNRGSGQPISRFTIPTFGR